MNGFRPKASLGAATQGSSVQSLTLGAAAQRPVPRQPAGPPPAAASPDLSEARDRLLLKVLGGLVVVLVLWAAFAPVDRIVRAQGRIVSADKAQIVQHLEGGIVQELLVHEGQKVKAGDLLMRLSPTQASSDFQQGQARLQTLRAMQARLGAEANGASQISFDPDIALELQQRERRAFQERAARMQSEQTVLRQQISQKQAELASVNERIEKMRIELALAQQQSRVMENLYRKGAASQMEFLESSRTTERLGAQYGDEVNSVPRLRAAVQENQARLNESSARLRAEARTELNQVSGEVERVNAAVGGVNDRLVRTEVRAPATGYVNRVYLSTVGGVAKPGDTLFEITPSEGQLAVEAKVRPDDRASLLSGLPARVKIGAYDYTQYGAMEGKLVEVSADTVPDQDGQRYYRIVVQANPASGALAQALILPGMTAQVDVVLGRRSVLSFLFSPLLRFSSEALQDAV